MGTVRNPIITENLICMENPHNWKKVSHLKRFDESYYIPMRPHRSTDEQMPTGGATVKTLAADWIS